MAKEGNITRAADILHITQPTLSRQLKDMEDELGVSLFIRGNQQITLTDAGVLFQQRADELVTLLEKTQRDLADQRNLVGGTVSIGCVESAASQMLPEVLAAFAHEHPMVRYDLYSANGDDIKEKLDRGEIDLGLLLEPVEAAKYDYIRLSIRDVWGIDIGRDHPIAEQGFVSSEEVCELPLILPRREIVQEQIASWLGVEKSQLHIFAVHNLLTNATLLAEAGLGYPVCVEGAYTIRKTKNVCFVPMVPERTTGHVLAWKKNRIFTTATSLFIQHVDRLLLPLGQRPLGRDHRHRYLRQRGGRGGRSHGNQRLCGPDDPERRGRRHPCDPSRRTLSRRF